MGLLKQLVPVDQLLLLDLESDYRCNAALAVAKGKLKIACSIIYGIFNGAKNSE